MKLFFATFALVLFIFEVEAEASLTYQVPSIAGLKEGWSLDGGQITTDGTLGKIDIHNIERWEFRFTSPEGSQQITSDGGFALSITTAAGPDLYGNDGYAGLLATNQSLSVKFPRYGGAYYGLFFGNQPIDSGDYSGQAFRFTVHRFTDPFLDPFFPTYQRTTSFTTQFDLVDGVRDPTRSKRLLNIFSAPHFNLDRSNHNQSYFEHNDRSGFLAVTFIPEPCTLAIVASLLASLSNWRRRILV